MECLSLIHALSYCHCLVLRTPWSLQMIKL
uniref:Uncharacterized protein n=1 Tax=Arundo donax TaxID=35708 RepID=A0A0A8XSK1_ARUDO